MAQLPQQQMIDIVKNTVILAIVLLVALTLATRFGIIYCGQIPYWCPVYKGIMRFALHRNYPAVLIVYGDSGMGDPEKLYMYIRRECRIYVRAEPLYRIGPGNLDQFDVVIVDHAKRMTGEQFNMLWDYVARGGKLVFVGDSGTDDDENGATFYAETNSMPKNPWDRILPDGSVVEFGTRLLGLRYVSNTRGSGPLVVQDDILTSAVPDGVEYSGPYARVQFLGSSVFGAPAVVMSMGKDPLIVRVGYRIVYYAFPPEYSLGHGSIQLAFLVRDLCDWMGT